MHPGGIRTDILRNARFYADAHGETDHARASDEFSRLARTTPEAAARIIVAAVRRGTPRVLIGGDARLIDRLQRWLPVRYASVIGAFVRLADAWATRVPRAARRRSRAGSTAPAPP